MEKKILIISGTHGNEHSAVELGLELLKFYKNNKNVKVIPFLNQSGLEANTREVQNYHTKDLNRSFGEEMTYKDCIDKIDDEVQQFDVVIDIHNSHRCANFCLIDKGWNEQVIINACYSSGVEYATRYSKGGTIKDYVNQLGKIGITYEFSGMQTLHNNDELERAESDIKDLVDYYQGKKEHKETESINELKPIHCLETGFIKFIYDINEYVTPGETIFEVYDEYGEVVETVKNIEEESIKLIRLICERFLSEVEETPNK